MKTTFAWLINKVLRNGVLAATIGVVIVTTASKALTQAVMIEIAGYASLAVLIANVVVFAFTQKNFVKSDSQGVYNVLAAIILGSFLLVGLCVLGIYFAKTDGAPALSTVL